MWSIKERVEDSRGYRRRRLRGKDRLNKLSEIQYESEERCINEYKYYI